MCTQESDTLGHCLSFGPSWWVGREERGEHARVAGLGWFVPGRVLGLLCEALMSALWGKFANLPRLALDCGGLRWSSDVAGVSWLVAEVEFRLQSLLLFPLGHTL